MTAMSTAIKICGISTVDALDAAVAARADYVGLVFFPPSPRHVDKYAAQELASRSGDWVKRVGLFVDADDEALRAGVEAGRLDAIQLHGDETPERVAGISSKFSLPVWKALPIANADDVEAARQYHDVADLILFDARTPKGAALPGGMGLRFDWSLLARWKGRSGWGLAGGLSPTNVSEAIKMTGAPLVDTSSGVETAPGQKNPHLIADFCKAVRNA